MDHSECRSDTFVDRSCTLYKGECRDSNWCDFIFFDVPSQQWHITSYDNQNGSCYKGELGGPSIGVLSDWDVARDITQDGAAEPFLDLVKDGTARCYSGVGDSQDYENDMFEIRCNKLGNTGGGSDAAAGQSFYLVTMLFAGSVVVSLSLS